MSWSNNYKKTIDCENPKGFSQKAHCAGRKKRQKGEKTESKSPFSEQFKPYKTPEEIAKKHGVEVSSIEKQLKIGTKVEHEHTKNNELAMMIALQHLDEIPDYYTRLSKAEKGVVKEDLRNWFDPNHPEGGWKRYNTKGEAIGPCAREPGEPKPKCLSNKKARQLRSQGGAEKIANAVRRKRSQDPVANRRGKGGKPKMVSNKIEENALNYDWDTPIRERADRYCPKCEKLELRHECKYGPRYWDMFSLPAEVITNKKDYKSTMPYPGPDVITSPQPLSTNQIKYNIATVHPANEAKEMDHEYSMARSELSKIENATKRLKKKMKGEGNIEAWVQSKITKAADYIDTAADYVDSGEMSEEFLLEKNVPTKPSLWSRAKSLAKKKFDVYPSAYANGWAAKWYKEHGGGWKSVSECLNWRDDYTPTEFESVNIIEPEPLNPSNWRGELEMIDELKCWKGYKRKKGSIPGEKGSCVKEGKQYKVGDVIPKSATEPKPKPTGAARYKFGVDKSGLEGPKNPLGEEIIMEAGFKDMNPDDFKNYLKSLNSDEARSVAKKVYLRKNPTAAKKLDPMGSVTINQGPKSNKGPEIQFKSSPSAPQPAAPRPTTGSMGLDPQKAAEQGKQIVNAAKARRAQRAAQKASQPMVTKVAKALARNPKLALIGAGLTGVAGLAGLLASRGKKSTNEQYYDWRAELIEAKKSEMKCNKPRAEAHGSGESGKSHVVKACEGGKEKLIRFGQLGVKGSPKKKGESKEYASRRHRFQTRHAKNIAKGKMSAAYWANRVKW